MSKSVNVFIADDHVLLRDALATVINSFSGYRVIAQASNGNEVIRQVESGILPDILILDLNMPELDGFDTAKILKQSHPEIKVLVLTMFDSEVALIRMLQVGARGFLKKDIHPKELKEALEALSNGGFHYTHATTGKLATLFIRDGNQPDNLDKRMLTEVEIKLLRYASTDLTYKEIAHQMKMTPRTIDNYRDHLFDKLEVKSRVGLVMYAIKNGLIAF